MTTGSRIVAALRDGEPLAADGPSALAEAGWPEQCLAPLDDEAAAELLDRVAPELDDRRRARILEAAGGNPLALSELPRAPADDAPPAGPALVPLTARLERTFAARASGLPAASRALLLVAAANDDDTLAEVLRAGSAIAGRALTVADLAPAIVAGLVDADGLALRFRHSAGALGGLSGGSARAAASRPMPRSRPRWPRNPTGRSGTGSPARRDPMTAWPKTSRPPPNGPSGAGRSTSRSRRSSAPRGSPPTRSGAACDCCAPPSWRPSSAAPTWSRI